jgi:ribonuclease HII
MKSSVLSKRPKAEFPDFTSEAALGFFASKLIIGVDEVGRGCLAGPVVAAAAVLCPEKIKSHGFKDNGLRPGGRRKALLFQVRDSKLVPEEERGPLAKYLAHFVVAHAMAEASVEEIESLNIYHASHLAMERAVAAVENLLGKRADAILVDGNRVPQGLIGRGVPLVKGDNRSISIAAAALLAKVHRDGMMQDYELAYPGYGFNQHKGYGTPFHLKKILALGITPIHRKSFRGVRREDEVLQDDLFPVFETAGVTETDGTYAE